mgnify:FL=1
MARNLNPPPSGVTGALGAWLHDLHAWVEGLPSISIASFGATDTPNSRVTGGTGALCVNIGSASTQSRFWLLGGPALSTRTDQGWVLVRVVSP